MPILNNQPVLPDSAASSGQAHTKNFKAFWPIVAVIVVALIAGGAIAYYSYGNILQDQIDSLVLANHFTILKHLKPFNVSTSSWQNYTDNVHGFQFQYPSSNNYTIGQNIGVIQELQFKNGLTVSVADSQSMQSGQAYCKTIEGECTSFVPSCLTNSCQAYTHVLGADFWLKDVVFFKGTEVIEFSQPIVIPGAIPSKLDDTELNSLIQAKKVNTQDLDEFSQIISSFKFLK